MAKIYKNKQDQYPKRTDYTDDSGIIDYGAGRIIVVESESPYGCKNLFYRFDDFKIALN